MTIIYKVRLVLAAILFVFAGIISAFSNTNPEDKLTKEQKQKQYEIFLPITILNQQLLRETSIR